MIQNIRFNTVNPLAVKIGAAQGPKSKITRNPFHHVQIQLKSCRELVHHAHRHFRSVTNKFRYLKRVPIDLSPSCSEGFPLICVKKNEDKFFF